MFVPILRRATETAALREKVPGVRFFLRPRAEPSPPEPPRPSEVSAKSVAEQRFLHSPPDDVGLAALAEVQEGYVSLEQLRALGMSEGASRHRVSRNRLIRVAPRVFAVGHVNKAWRGRLWAARLHAGDDGFITGRSGLALNAVVREHDGPIHVISERQLRSNAVLIAHRTRVLPPQDVTTVDGFPVTSLARSMLEFAATATDRQVQRALNEAEVLRLFDLRSFEDVLARANGHRGSGRLRRELATIREGLTITDSEAEERFLDFVRRRRLPMPQVQARIAGWSVDFFWPEYGVIVEIDGAQFHGTVATQAKDRKKWRELSNLGHSVLPFAAVELADEDAMLADLAAVGITPEG